MLWCSTDIDVRLGNPWLPTLRGYVFSIDYGPRYSPQSIIAKRKIRSLISARAADLVVHVLEDDNRSSILFCHDLVLLCNASNVPILVISASGNNFWYKFSVLKRHRCSKTAFGTNFDDVDLAPFSRNFWPHIASIAARIVSSARVNHVLGLG